jgi:hypothetical protein
MVAFAALIVISKDAFSRDDKSKPVFEGMCAARNRFRQMLQNNLEKRIVADGPAGLLNEDGLHVVICNNTPWLSMETTLLANPVSVPRDNGCRYARREVPIARHVFQVGSSYRLDHQDRDRKCRTTLFELGVSTSQR